MSRSFFLLAGEASGDTLGSALITALDTLYPNSDYNGMGGPKMISKGLNSHEDMTQLSIMGISEALSAYNRLNALADRLVEQVLALKPEAVFTIDSKAFSARFAKKLRKKMHRSSYQAPIIHMVAPTIWAWGPWRRNAFETAFDGLLCLFPFEPDLFDPQKVKADFIGHPVGFNLPVDTTKRNPNIVGLLPGSRRSEIRYILPDMLEAARIIITNRPDVRFLLPTLPHLKDEIYASIKKSQLPIDILSDKDGFPTLLNNAAACIAASGTVTLELALQSMPTVTCYKVNLINYLFMRGLFKLKDPILPHILLQKKIFPYFEQREQTGANLATSLFEMLDTHPSNMQHVSEAANTLSTMLTGGETSFQMQLQSALQRQLHP